MTELPDRDARRAALTDFEQNLVVTAGAGTGKTSLLVGRLLTALVRQRLDPREVLALTFTEAAATEMRERLERLLRSVEPWLDGKKIEESDRYVLEEVGLWREDLSRVQDVLGFSDQVAISTFHGFCLRFLQDNARALGIPPGLSADAPANLRRDFDLRFTHFLQDLGGLDPVLVRFEPHQLCQLAWALHELPASSWNKIGETPALGQLDRHIADLEGLIAHHTKAREPWRQYADSLLTGYRTLSQGERPTVAEIDKKTPAAGARQLGKEVSEQATEALTQHADRLKPYAQGDDETVSAVIEFLMPFIEDIRRKSAHSGMASFDELLLLTRASLMRKGTLRSRIGSPLKAILVDEFQDTDPLQYDILFLLAAMPGEDPVDEPMDLELRPGSLFIVGDAKQSVYRFRRADIAAFFRAVEKINAQGGIQLELTANFRSRPEILHFVNGLCERSLTADPPYQHGYEAVQATRDRGVPDAVSMLRLNLGDKTPASARRKAEGWLAVETIKELRQQEIGYGDIVILLRAATDTNWLLRPLRIAEIPYVLDGSKRFYRRQEIVLATALIAAMARPHDPVAVLTLLRSVFSDARDSDILAFAQEHDSLDFRLVTDEEGPVQDCLRCLRKLHLAICEMPIDGALRCLLARDEFLIGEGSGYEGAQRLANIDRLLHQLLGQRPIDLQETADLLEQRAADETDDEESPLFDQDMNAVRVMTMHKAKGLEFPVVILPDLAREDRAGRSSQSGSVQRLFTVTGEEIVGVRIGGVSSTASLIADGEAKRHSRAEEQRIFYVAATRAEERLVMFGSGSSRRPSPWQDDIDAIDPGLFTLREAKEPEPTPRTRNKDVDVQGTIRAYQAFTASVRALADRSTPIRALPSSAGEDHATTEGDASSRERALSLGNCAHEYLALVDMDLEGPDEGLIETLTAGLEDLREDVMRIARQFHASDLHARIQNAKQTRREVAIAYMDDKGQDRSGIIDLLLEEKGSAWTIIDYKTDQVEPGKHQDAAQRHEPQLSAYGEGVMRALELSQSPAREIHFLRDDVTIKL
ncbi:MAG: UvrD-helicase domain-containing protein [Planctomycetota bacterium]|nr:UvrD-helicase domain-containing protein [Planctomycetota bacterium]